MSLSSEFGHTRFALMNSERVARYVHAYIDVPAERDN